MTLRPPLNTLSAIQSFTPRPLFRKSMMLPIPLLISQTVDKSWPEFGDESIRELLVKPYRLVYKLTDEHAFIVAFIHGAQRLWRI
jgi:hypothetical protein